MLKLTSEEIQVAIQRCPNWNLGSDFGNPTSMESICLDWTGVDFEQTFLLMTQIAAVAEEFNHHPDWCNSFRKLSIRLTTHDVGGLSELDFTMAERIDELIDRLEQG